MGRLATLLLGVIVVAALAAGCGGDEDGDDSLSKAEFVEQAEAACREEKGDLLEKFNVYGANNERQGEDPAEQRARLFRAVQLPILEAELAALRELDVPPEEAARLRAFLDAEQRAIDAATRARDEADEIAMRRQFDAAAKQAEAYGIAACANPGSGLVGR